VPSVTRENFAHMTRLLRWFAFTACGLGHVEAARVTAMGIVGMFFLFGTNHLVAFVTRPDAWLHAVPLVANYGGVAVGALAIRGARAVAMR